MAAGLGFKDFVTGEVLTAADVDGYLMQGVWVFASAAARDAAVTSPQEGNFAYLKDTNVTTYYTGSAWANLDTTGMTNPMTTTGDIIYSSPGSTPVRLGIGTANQVLKVNSGATAPEWGTPAAGGGMTLIQETVASALSSLSFTSLGSYKQLLLMWNGLFYSGNGNYGRRFNNNSGSVYTMNSNTNGATDFRTTTSVLVGWPVLGQSVTSATFNERARGYLLIDNYTSAKYKFFEGESSWKDNQYPTNQKTSWVGSFDDTTAITTLDIVNLSGAITFSNATDTSIRLYGIS